MWPQSPSILHQYYDINIINHLVDGVVQFSNSCWYETGPLGSVISFITLYVSSFYFNVLPLLPFSLLRRWSAVRWTRSSRSSCLASLPCSSPPSPPPPLLPPLPPPLPLFLKLRLLPKKQDLASEDGPFSDQWTKREERMTGIIDLWFDDGDYADADDTFGEDLDLFFDTCIIFASMPSHSATSLGAVLLYVQCVCFQAGVLVFLCSGLFLFSRLLQFLKNQGCDIARLTF